MADIDEPEAGPPSEAFRRVLGLLKHMTPRELGRLKLTEIGRVQRDLAGIVVTRRPETAEVTS